MHLCSWLSPKTWKKVRIDESRRKRHQCPSEASVATFLRRLSRLPTFEVTPTTNWTSRDTILALIWPLFGGSLTLFALEDLALPIDRAIALDFWCYRRTERIEPMLCLWGNETAFIVWMGEESECKTHARGNCTI
ncbi:hypothetical protein M0R45_029343 [Rubus argutus]|uniref:Uncharacterized protein n=1 Tax=Rubus argutus TaxID=59490 RepID=A0AAW1W7X4_RUBAR